MKKLNELFEGQEAIEIKSIQEDSRVKDDNYLFCCIEGLTVDGHDYAKQAVENGAVAVVASKDVDVNVPVIKVKDTNRAMSLALSKFYDEPEKKIKMIGITGTDGKTTLATIIYQLINKLDKGGYIGTNGVWCPDFHFSTKLTTPLPRELYAYLDDFVKKGCHYVTMEVSSERLMANRLDNLLFDMAIYTNITPEHLNNHKTMENYIQSKCKLFKAVKNDGYCIVNNDDEYANDIKEACNGKLITYGIDNKADIMASDIIVNEDRLQFKLHLFDQQYDIISPLSGRFNVYNLMAAIIACQSLGFNIDDIIVNIKQLEPVSARAESLDFGQPYKIIIDYAHTANALKNLLEYVKIIAKGKIITITGSAGGRDREKRPVMGKVVTDLSDHVIFTADDPRMEDPNDIIDDLIAKVKDTKNNYERIVDRAEAIRKALSIANKDDIIVIAGKGRDDYMYVGNGTVPHSDVEVIRKYFNR